MENSRFIKIMLSVAIIFFVVITILSFFKVHESKNNTVGIPNKDNSEILDSFEIQKQYIDIEEISGDYTLQRAISDNCYVIDQNSVSYNEDVLSNFIEDISNSKNSKFRIAMETVDSLLYILDIESSGDKFVITQNERQLSGDIKTNEYMFSEGYSFENELVILADGTQLESYYLSKKDSEERIDLFAYVVGIE